MKLRAATWDYDTNAASDESGIDCRYKLNEETGELEDNPSMAKQSFAEECDINVMLKRFGITGQMPQGLRLPEYGDYEQVVDFQTAMNIVVEARETFMEMPAHVRARFHNDPQEFLEFCADEKNKDEAVKLGLVVEPEPLVELAPKPVEPAVTPS